MAHIALIYRTDVRASGPVLCYPHCYASSLLEKGHVVTLVGEGHEFPEWDGLPEKVRQSVDLVLEIDNGRGSDGKLRWKAPQIEGNYKKAVVFIDSHGHPDNHAAAAPSFDHVFFAVWRKRDLFAGHPSAYWCPNVTDFRYFGRELFVDEEEKALFGFFGSKLGLARADTLVQICKEQGYSYAVAEAVKPRRNRWPETGRRMSECRILFNRGQKHDGPNQRVMESMAVGRPLLCDADDTSGMPKLFVDGTHYISYDPNSLPDLREKMQYLLDHPTEAARIAEAGYLEVRDRHQVQNRVDQILATCLGV